MRQASAPGASDLVELLKQAAAEGRITLMLAAPPSDNAELSLVTTCALVFGLRPAESRTLLKLVAQNHVTRREMHAAMSGDGNPVSDPRIIDTTVCSLRKKLALHGVEIVTRPKLGHQLTEDSRDKVRKMLAGHGADIADAAAPAPDNSRPRRAKPEAA